MVAADSAKTTKSAAIFVRADDESVMLSSPPIEPELPGSLYRVNC
jgi:hypothetical protein